jgi:hypothetical protein
MTTLLSPRTTERSCMTSSNHDTPFGFLGKVFDKLVLRNYLTNLIRHRNSILKAMAENQD